MVVGGCSSPQVSKGLINVTIAADHKDLQVKIPAGSTVRDALNSEKITISELDRVDPAVSTVLSEGVHIKVIRVREEYHVEQVVIPFVHQELKNEALAEGDRRLSQSGVNGLEEITYHRVFEDGVEISNNPVKTTVIKEAIPEVVMIGSSSTYNSIGIPGKITYLSAGNAWVMENSTDNRSLVVSTGDLDGRIFSLSQNGSYLLFTRFSSGDHKINSLWVALLESNPVKIIDLGVDNIVNFADFDPASNIVAYSTAEWRETQPGWQANNDLYELVMGADGPISAPQVILEANSGGVYGWWGTEFSWAPDAASFLYSRPDGIGILYGRDKTQTSILNIEPYQTGGNWAWVPGSTWSPVGNVIYTVQHVSTESNDPGTSQEFDLVAIPLLGGSPVNLVKNVGMFSHPVASPMTIKSNYTYDASGEKLDQNAFWVAYLQANYPDQSQTSGYRLFIIDRDGSNKKGLFPEEGAAGLEPQQVVWSPVGMGQNGEYAIAFIYNGNMWIVDVGTGIAQQISGDGLTTRIDWR